ncbi:signal peptidase II [Candidatus Thioglobus sp.]|jgi:signal peptidase II|uniref:signal peptidase II n=1 Tax=Candidatus Thioglobus sp. TaxID=2026721 RepID=UPI00175D4E8A|nr:signal peptidase II [Candidatus Thioglobus sp.]
MKLKYYFLLVVFLVVLDQLTKLLIYGYIKPGESVVVNPFFSLRHVHNYGAAFSFLADAGGWQRYFLSAVSIIVSIVIAVWMVRVDTKYVLKLSALSMLLAGAIGNLIDRLSQGFVLDFIDLHYRTFYWPVFNVADILISLGVVLLIFSDLKKS